MFASFILNHPHRHGVRLLCKRILYLPDVYSLYSSWIIQQYSPSLVDRPLTFLGSVAPTWAAVLLQHTQRIRQHDHLHLGYRHGQRGGVS